MPKFSIITPCFNAEKYIAETVTSVLTQTAVLSGRVALEYIICDGKSTDNTVAVVEQTVARHGVGAAVRILSERDAGMYDALAKGLSLASGDICAYINAGDYYNEHAFDVVLDVFSGHEVNWLTGMITICNEKSEVVSSILPCGYRSSLIRTGFYGRKLPFIQQESTFWRKALTEKIDLMALSQFKYAGDYFLWYQFARTDDLALVEAYLGTFKIHQGQISEDLDNYFRELVSFCDKPCLRDRLLACYDRLMWQVPKMVQTSFYWRPVLRYDHLSQSWKVSN